MPEKRDGDPDIQDRQVWLLGGIHPDADRSISWDDELPNLSDPDVLVVDLTTLTAGVLAGIDQGELGHARASIRDKIRHHGTVVVIMQPLVSTLSRDGSHELSNHDVIPVPLATSAARSGRTIVAGGGHSFKDYLDRVASYSFYIEKCTPKVVDSSRLGADETTLRIDDGMSITDNSGHVLGLVLRAPGFGGRSDHSGNPAGEAELVLLPPPTEPAEDAIGRILSVYGKAPAREVPPAWAAAMAVPGSGRLGARIEELEREAQKIHGKIAGLKSEKTKIDSHLRLLYSKGAELEDAVSNALRTLGFDEVRGGRDSGKEDWVLDASTNGYSRIVIEVKGADARTGKRGLLQCSEWVDELFGLDGKQTKGVFIPNQHRLEGYPGSRAEKVRIEADVQTYARTRGICIIPACALFEAVKTVLGGEAPNREEIEARITKTSGLLEDVLGGGGD